MRSYVVSSYGALSDLHKPWSRLSGPFENPLLDHAWYLSCAETFYREHHLRIIIVESAAGIAAIAPLACVSRNGIERLEILGASALGEPCGFIYESEEALRELAAAVLQLKRPVLLQRLAGGTPIAGAMKRTAKRRGLSVERRGPDSRSIIAAASWDDYERSLSPQRRYDLRRARGRAEAAGQVSARIFCPEPDELERHLETAFRIEASGWKGRRGSALARHEGLGTFFRRYADRASREGILRLCFLSVGGQAIAMQLCVESADRFWVLKIGYDESWSRCSPGTLLTLEAVKYTFAQGLKSYEFLGSDEPWLRAWGGKVRTHVSLGVYPCAPRGLAGLASDAGRYLVERSRRTLFGSAERSPVS